MKLCRDCNSTLQNEFFHKREASIDGLSAKCKKCQSKYDKSRLNKPSRVAARNAYALTGEGIASANKSKSLWAKRNPLKHQAITDAGNAIRNGKIKKEPCEICGAWSSLHAHHDDYSKPLSIRWLCSKHHRSWHAKNGEALNG